MIVIKFYYLLKIIFLNRNPNYGWSTKEMPVILRHVHIHNVVRKVNRRWKSAWLKYEACDWIKGQFIIFDNSLN